ncbi:hypothetical protein F5Y17DRAFT_460849 [Xylariaceae sp. FL0594]|nr:hypothetical protein F5Y17DRAFT_460849 [Xylariaceae sp. FL0594]
MSESFLDLPALSPPPGIVPDFAHLQNQNALYVSVVVISLALATAACAVRVYSKIAKERRAKVEDVLGLVGFLGFVAYVGSGLWKVHYRGAFLHQWDVRLRDLSPLLLRLRQEVHLSTNFYSLTMLTVKSAILLEWRRIFVPFGTRNKFYWACMVLLLFNILYYGAGIIAANLACIPYRAIWDVTVKGKCINQRGLITSGTAINVISDIAILFLPQRVIWRLNMSRRKKQGVSVAFAVRRLYLLTDDSLYQGSAVSLWAVAEMTCAVLVFCVPSFPRAFSGDGVATRLAATFRTWGTAASKSLLSATDHHHHHHATGKSTPQNDDDDTIGPYSRIDDKTIALNGLSSQRSVLVTSDCHVPGPHPQSGVLFTKHFTAEEEFLQHPEDDDIRVAAYQKQHPWSTDAC